MTDYYISYKGVQRLAAGMYSIAHVTNAGGTVVAIVRQPTRDPDHELTKSEVLGLLRGYDISAANLHEKGDIANMSRNN